LKIAFLIGIMGLANPPFCRSATAAQRGFKFHKDKDPISRRQET
jgi:hypothetical protein